MVSKSAPAGPLACAASDSAKAALEAIAEALTGLRYGTIELVVHDGRVVQLDVTERRRFS
jgi:hypothetical protein